MVGEIQARRVIVSTVYIQIISFQQRQIRKNWLNETRNFIWVGLNSEAIHVIN